MVNPIKWLFYFYVRLTIRKRKRAISISWSSEDKFECKITVDVQGPFNIINSIEEITIEGIKDKFKTMEEFSQSISNFKRDVIQILKQEFDIEDENVFNFKTSKYNKSYLSFLNN